ncbi:MAG: ABC transporter ATP-binding protein [Marivibrio sp.]|uniref:ABC transporter ATP-binding protein n=1 Tax=Marivibrio sp. TaxID=2039719 RepID=UPI0032ED9E3A
MPPADGSAGSAPPPTGDSAADARAEREREGLRALPASLYRFVWRESRRRQVLLCLLTALVFPLSLAPLELQRRIVDGAIRDPNVELLVTLCLIYLASAVAHSLTKFARNMAVGAIAERTARDLRLHILERTGLIEHRSAPVTKKEDKTGHEGSAVSLIAAEAEKVGAFAGDAISQPLMQAGIMLSVLGYMLYIDWRTAAASLAVYIPAAALAPMVQRCINRHVQRKTTLMRRLGDVTAGTDAAEDGMAPGGLRARHADRPEILTLDVMKARLCIFLYKFGFKAFNNLMGELGRLSVLFVGGWFVIQGETEVGVLVAFLSGLEKVADPARELLNFYRQLSQSRVQYDILRRAVDDGAVDGARGAG